MRAAYIHKAEYLDARKAMMQWWSDYLDMNREGYVAPYVYAQKRNEPQAHCRSKQCAPHRDWRGVVSDCQADGLLRDQINWCLPFSSSIRRA